MATAGLGFTGRQSRLGGRRLSVWPGFANPGRSSFFVTTLPTSCTHWNRFFHSVVGVRVQRAETPGKVTFLGAGFHEAGQGRQKRRLCPLVTTLRGAVASCTTSQSGTWTPEGCSGHGASASEGWLWRFCSVTVPLRPLLLQDSTCEASPGASSWQREARGLTTGPRPWSTTTSCLITRHCW